MLYASEEECFGLATRASSFPMEQRWHSASRRRYWRETAYVFQGKLRKIQMSRWMPNTLFALVELPRLPVQRLRIVFCNVVIEVHS